VPAADLGQRARYVSAFDASVGSATLPQGSLYSVAGNGFNLIEAHFMRSGAAAGLAVRLQRLTSAGTPGATQAIGKYDDDGPAALCLPKLTHTVAPTLGQNLHVVRLPTSASTGVIWTFHDTPIKINVGTANGCGWLPTTPSGAADVTFVWEE
jgi:hypothetical protein